MLQPCSEKQREVDVIGLIRTMTRGRKKGCKEKKVTNIVNKDLNKVMCFSCHEMGHYAIQCPFKRGKVVK